MFLFLRKFLLSKKKSPSIAVVLHVFYEDVALDIIDRLQRAQTEFTLFITHNRALSVRLLMRLSELDRKVVFIMSANVGRDTWPFIQALNHPEMSGHDLVCKLHTKQGQDQRRRRWRSEMLNKTIGQGDVLDVVADALASDSSILMAGPDTTYISSKKFMYRNESSVENIAGAIGLDTSIDWGFFAGTMFWARRHIFDPLLTLDLSEASFEEQNTEEDGQMAHALERVFGLLPGRGVAVIRKRDDNCELAQSDPLLHSIPNIMAQLERDYAIAEERRRQHQAGS